MSIVRLSLAVLIALSVGGCVVDMGHLFGPLFEATRAVPNKTRHPVRPDARLAVLWVGHATVLVQLDDKLVMTDPVFTSSAGQLAARVVEPGLDPDVVPPLDAVVISHLHFDHLSLGTLELLEPRIGALLVPERGLVYVTNFDFPTIELPTWRSWEHDGLRITAVPVRHNGMRYGLDAAWMTTGATGYVIEHGGLTVYFAGDTAYDPERFRETRRRFPKIDLALLPIAPIEPRSFMGKHHMDPDQAVSAYLELGARWMVPVHFDTFVNSRDDIGDAPRRLRAALRERHIGADRVLQLEIGEQRVLVSSASRAK